MLVFFELRMLPEGQTEEPFLGFLRYIEPSKSMIAGSSTPSQILRWHIRVICRLKKKKVELREWVIFPDNPSPSEFLGLKAYVMVVS